MTPEAEPRRYDTRFYVAALPATAEPVGVGTEMDACRLVRRRPGLSWPARRHVWAAPSEVGETRFAGGLLAAATGRDLEPVGGRRRSETRTATASSCRTAGSCAGDAAAGSRLDGRPGDGGAPPSSHPTPAR